MSNEWQPIKTAPRDGTLILLYGPCEWDFYVTPSSPSMVVVGFYDDEYSEDPSSAWLTQTNNPYQDRVMATHWMPLPKPPCPYADCGSNDRFDEYTFYGENNPPVMSNPGEKDYEV